MFTDRAYSRGLLASPDRLASLLYFAAAVPTVGFIHGAADLTPLNAAALEGCYSTRHTAATGQPQPGAECRGLSVSRLPAVAP
jgi:hypothetical protein